MDELSLSINEIFYSLQGESSQAGRPCTFVRLKGCPLRCSWCDTEYAFFEGSQLKFSEILSRVRDLNGSLVEVTGGEPLAQRNCIPFLEKLVTEGFEVMLETSGAFDISQVPKSVRIIMDIKAPASLEESKNLWSNLKVLKPGFDEIKIVIQDRADFDYAVKVCEENKLLENFTVLVSAVAGKLSHVTLADWILESRKPFRFQHQLHKMLWPSKERGF
jgi:7-carboxy-7-deazaguanine synthase